MADNRNSRVDEVIETWVGSGRIVGHVLLVLEDGEPVLERYTGYADREAGRVVEADTIFRLASLTKALVNRLVTGPLGMSDTGFWADDDARLAAAYADDPPGAPERMGSEHALAVEGAGPIRYAPGRALDKGAYPSGGAGMVGTARDYALLLEAIRTGGSGVLSSETAAAMVQDQVPGLEVLTTHPNAGFGLGVEVAREGSEGESPRTVGSWGWAGVYGSTYVVDPGARRVVISLSNTALSGAVGPFPDALEEAAGRPSGR
jgi:CubicO group peptidase (beta-lactamase class C family)